MVDRLAADLRAEFPDARGFSSANLRYMRSFAEAWPDPGNSPTGRWQIALGPEHRAAGGQGSRRPALVREAALEHGWSRPVLAAQIDTAGARPPGQGDDEFFPRPAARNLGSRAAGAEGSLPVRFPDPGRRPVTSATSSAPWSPGSRICCSNSARAFPSSQASIISRSAARISMSTCCSIIASCAASSPST